MTCLCFCRCWHVHRWPLTVSVLSAMPASCSGLVLSAQVLGRMKQAMVEHSSSASHSFLLDDDSTLPFAANDILAQMDDKVSRCSMQTKGQCRHLLPNSRSMCCPS